MTTPVKKDQVDLNIEFYTSIYRKCLREAETIAHEKNWGSDSVLEMAETIFKQFFADQTAVAGQSRQTKALVDGMQSVLESRGR